MALAEPGTSACVLACKKLRGLVPFPVLIPFPISECEFLFLSGGRALWALAAAVRARPARRAGRRQKHLSSFRRFLIANGITDGLLVAS
jgi:hypothetical protein